MKNKIIATVGLLLVSSMLVIGVYRAVVEQEPLTPEEVINTIDGRWVSNGAACMSLLKGDSLFEFTFGADIPAGTMNAIRTDKYKFDATQIVLEKSELSTTLDNFFSGCEAFEKPRSAGNIVTYDNFIEKRTFVFYPYINIVLAVESEGIFVLQRLEDIKSLPRYEKTIESADL